MKIKNYIPLQFIGTTAITKDIREWLWDNEINADDMDYIIIAPIEHFDPEYSSSTEWGGCLTPKITDMERLLQGVYKNYWYIANDGEKDVAVGVAYHS